MMKRYAGIDILKVIAVLSVMSVHFFLNTGYYKQDLSGGENLFAQTFLRWALYISVPLFIMATGYLQSKKEISAKYYKGILAILGIYLFYSIASILVRENFFDQHYAIIDWVYFVFSFRADGYAWYVNMYIGLFLLIPFLNIIFNQLKSKKEHLILISSFVFICGLPIFNNFTVDGKHFIFFPDWWKDIWPVIYYFIGAYLKKYQPDFNKFILSGVFIVATILETVITLHYSNGKTFSRVVDGYNSLFVIVSAAAFFMVFIKVDIKSDAVKKSLAFISGLTLDIYLASYMVDLFVYRYVMKNVFESQFQIIYYMVPTVGTTAMVAILISIVRKLITDLISKASIRRSVDVKELMSKTNT